ncbi:MAG TPA: DNA mismatch repair endonuclease MutL [Anaerolineales bacterium]|nr:DNA mismatch repair endonuclease MutL [Anaerolineales bacterium]
MPIHLLPSEVASQIAAGEVVERPASVIKELLENALDAKASQVSIHVEGAGKRLVEIADNGCGIPAAELALALERHATSKLERADDLFRIATLGFRGEALASIGSVARLTLTSRPAAAEGGARLRVEGGHVGQLELVGAPVGTVVRVEDLFYNVPARLKFLKQDATERRHIDELVTRYALAYPHVRFHLHQDGRPALMTSGNGDRREVLATLYGVDIARQMLEVISEEDGLRVTGFISPTSLTRSNRREIIFFVNGRPVQDASLSAALMQAYHTLLMVGRYPLAAMFLEIDPEAVDVNVHPTKAEVRFRSGDQVFRGVQRAVRRALLAHNPLPEVSPGFAWSSAAASTRPSPQPGLDWGMVSAEQQATSSMPELPPPQGPIQPVQPALPGTRMPLLRLVGQVASAYLVAEGPDGLYLIDQHAAHERILFERFMALRAQSPNGIPAQSLLEPQAVELPPASARLVEDQMEALNDLGFKVEPFGRGTFLVRAIPALLAGMNPAAALAVLVEDFEEDETPLQAEVEARIVARVCKRAAVKAGKILSGEEQRTLLADLEACQSPRTCPHGRPTMILLSVDLLERQFGRRGAR